MLLSEHYMLGIGTRPVSAPTTIIIGCGNIEAMAVSTMTTAIEAVDGGDVVYVGGFGFAQPFSAVHELIRQGVSDLHVIRSSGGVLLDQLVGAGCVSETTIAHCWNAVGPTPTSAFRRAAEDGVPRPITVEEHGLGNLVLRLFAGARRLPFVPAGPVESTGQFENQSFSGKFSEVTFDGDSHYVMEPLNPDVSIIHVPRADERGNAQLTGARAEIKHGAMAADTLLVTTEEVVSSEQIQDTPDETVVPGFMIDHVVESPGGAHPSGVLGCYGRDIDYLEHYGEVTGSLDDFEAYLDEWVYGVSDRAEYLEAVRASGFAEVSP
jgi:glutaconate CoA-transferase subunit A